MQLTTRLPKRRQARPARPSRPARPARAPELEPPERRDARRAGGPQDQALYTCVCGYAFTAAVTTSVDCPHCGQSQAW